RSTPTRLAIRSRRFPRSECSPSRSSACARARAVCCGSSGGKRARASARASRKIRRRRAAGRCPPWCCRPSPSPWAPRTSRLGFAFLEEPDLTIEIVDVPGHERFVKNMLAGVGGIDLAMLVIAADEGVMPQTREHLAICALLHIPGGLVVLTKADLVEPDWLELVKDDVAGLVRGTFLDGAPVVAASAKTGAGLDGIRATLRDLAAK